MLCHRRLLADESRRLPTTTYLSEYYVAPTADGPLPKSRSPVLAANDGCDAEAGSGPPFFHVKK
ncbi:hypothetical protein DSI35_13895 [Mycobacterium tuberculosis]|uniref:Uncharacterized protein n=4 Tax=Mycobacterium tuberculosis complex TaxID=77643 RepID=Q8VKC4_MYCTO|nr:hypothetical protein MT0895 [Mycobacterium tuberculosis CDC1551]AGE66841.1 hypothetical protein K60_009310 [Mycobacterium tuberculosis variant bovis BCG str. Korea 1168P]AKR00499.1 hypothetical protein Mb1595_p0976 [Mycobacterium tuberculosis variant bovis]ANZ81507.1 Hypothetical protein BEE65_0904 [Mycobacterium tuberculosis]AYP11329.1 hypothetical protein EBQ37_05205 [Mycobacterium tuberculosis variant bovis BCG]EPZ63814.1 hypothetical protein TBKG_01502 [Mycobacterium tuberculosis '98-R6